MEKKTISSRLIDKCLITGGDVLDILDFGMHPYADTFISEQQLNLSEPVFPLQCTINPQSGQIQLKYVSNDDDRYNLYEYSYTSANSQFSRNHWDNYFETVKNRYQLQDKSVLEIGSNDGYLISKFKNVSKQFLGIDSSKEMCKIANENGTDTINAIFNLNLAEELKLSGSWDIVIANNVFNHSNDPVNFAAGVSHLLSESGVFIFELPYWGKTLESGKFDQVYHEHVSYFTLKSSLNLLTKVGLQISDFEIVDYHGGSIRVYAQKVNSPIEVSSLVKNFIKEEEGRGLFDIETYKNFQKDIINKRNNFLNQLYKIKTNNPNSVIIGVGAAAKANTFLNYYKIDKTILDYITDSSRYKQGKYTPLTRIPIVSDNIFSQYSDDTEVYALILSWNISDQLKSNLLSINPNVKFINLI